MAEAKKPDASAAALGIASYAVIAALLDELIFRKDMTREDVERVIANASTHFSSEVSHDSRSG